LKRLFVHAEGSRIDPRLLAKVQRVLTLLQAAETPEDMNLPGYMLHPLTGDRRGFWSIRVSGNWRVIFRIEEGQVYDVDLVDYH
jgi:proteic killer suppression protein